MQLLVDKQQAATSSLYCLRFPMLAGWLAGCCAGAVRQPLPFDEAQGQPLLLDINNGFLAVLTSKALVRVFKLAGAGDVKPHAGPGAEGCSCAVRC